MMESQPWRSGAESELTGLEWSNGLPNVTNKVIAHEDNSEVQPVLARMLHLGGAERRYQTGRPDTIPYGPSLAAKSVGQWWLSNGTALETVKEKDMSCSFAEAARCNE